MHNVKKVVGWLLAAFLIYAIFTSPGRAGDIVHTSWEIVSQGFSSLGSFFDAVLNRG